MLYKHLNIKHLLFSLPFVAIGLLHLQAWHPYKNVYVHQKLIAALGSQRA